MSWDVMGPAYAPSTRAASLRGNCRTLTLLLMQSGEIPDPQAGYYPAHYHHQ